MAYSFQHRNCFFVLFNQQHDAVSMNKVRKMRSSMFSRNLYSVTIQKRCWPKSGAKKMRQQFVGECSKWMNHFTVVESVAWIQRACCALIASNSQHIVITNTRWAHRPEADVVTVEITKHGNRTITVMNTKWVEFPSVATDAELALSIYL